MLRCLLILVFALAPLARSNEGIPLSAALRDSKASLSATGNGRDTLQLQFTAPAKVKLTVPAGSTFRSEAGEAQITLRSVTVETGPDADADAILPAASISSRNVAAARSVTFSGSADPKLTKLLELFAQQDDLPRPTAQLAVFIILEDLTWAAWKEWMKAARGAEAPLKPHPTPAEIAQAVDAIAFAKLSAPDAKLAILQDEELKRLALRNPWARGKAMALYGLSVEDAITGDSSLPVDLGKLLHTSPNDNCPICRQRAKSPAEIP